MRQRRPSGDNIAAKSQDKTHARETGTSIQSSFAQQQATWIPNKSRNDTGIEKQPARSRARLRSWPLQLRASQTRSPMRGIAQQTLPAAARDDGRQDCELQGAVASCAHHCTWMHHTKKLRTTSKCTCTCAGHCESRPSVPRGRRQTVDSRAPGPSQPP